MPGLVGIVSITGERVDPGLIQAMRKMIQHRDWYRVDDYVNAPGTVAIARVYLGIINPEAQPFSAREGKIKVFLRGEIYNDDALGADPLVYIYRLYERYGGEFAAFLKGSFLVVIVDELKDRVLIANDRLATKPLFYFNDGRAFYFSPEMKSLFVIPSLARKLNLAAVADFLANGQFTRDHTLIEGLETMDKATVIEITSQGTRRYQYWEFSFKERGEDQGRAAYQAELAMLLRQAVRRRLQTDHTYGILLSGGYDSRAILGCYLEAKSNRELHTISWGRAETIPRGDCLIARRLAHKLGADHHFYPLTAEEVFENFYDFVWLGEGLTWFPESYQIFHRIREQQAVDVVLRGDECFGYSHWMTVHDEQTMFRALDLRVFRNMPEYQKILKPTYYRLFSDLDAETIRLRSARCSARRVHNRKDFFYLDIRLKKYLHPLNYVKTFALESFNPLLDYDLLDFVSALPLKYRLGKRLYRETVVDMFPALYHEIAEIQDIIDWDTSIKASREIKGFIYRELIEDFENPLSEFMDKEGLKAILDTFFETSMEHASLQGRTHEVLRTTSPLILHWVHKGVYYAKKWTGRVRHSLSPARLILHLLILKVWGDLFLNLPTYKEVYD